MKGVKTAHCLDINNTNDLLDLHYDDLDFELGPAPHYYLKLKYPIHSVHPTQCLSVDPTPRQLGFNINADYIHFEINTRRTINPKFDANGVDDAGLDKKRSLFPPTITIGPRSNMLPDSNTTCHLTCI